MATIITPPIAADSGRLYPAAVLALIAEVVLLGGAWVLLSHKSPAPAAVPITLLSIATPPQSKPVPPAPPVPKTQPQEVQHKVTPTPVHHVAHVIPPRPMSGPAPVPVPAPAPPSATPTEPAPAPHPQPPALPPAPAAPNASFEGALRAAIQAALHYPESARLAGISGRTRVAFQYQDGAVSGVRVVVSSGIGLLDRAAVAAVEGAPYPKPEPAFVGRTLSEQLWVTFDLNSQG